MMNLKTFFPGLVVALATGAAAQTGTSFCMSNPNSTGSNAQLAGHTGTGVGSGLHLGVSSGVPSNIAYFMVGNEATSGVVISDGMFCLAGTSTSQFYRYNAGTLSNSIGVFDSSGDLQNLVGTSLSGYGFDVPSFIPDGVPTSILAGDTWHFQAWYRDSGAGAGHSNFSNGLSVTFSLPFTIGGMVKVLAGDFEMGSNAAIGVPPYFGNPQSQPVHSVTITEDFWMGQHEVTQAEFQAIMGTNPSTFQGTNMPVETVTWGEARTYCAALTAQEVALGHLLNGWEYRLPTEAEWEYASRAKSVLEFNTGTALFCADANFGFSYHSNLVCGTTSPVDVGSYPQSDWGLYDMHGNVSEWCLDSFALYTAGAVSDPFITGSGFKISRGGSWFTASNFCRSAARDFGHETVAVSSLGFRVVLAPILVP